MIEVKNVYKWYGTNLALNNLNFTVKSGEILGFLGPNGAGKSTTMNIITGYLSSTKGTITVDNNEILDNPKAVKKKIGYLPEIPPLYPEMTVRAYINFMFDLKKIKLKKEEHINEICELVSIEDVYDRLIKNLSKGYKQRVGLASALLGYPPVIILDEPTVGLDPKQIIEIRNLIKSFGKKHTVILSSHALNEIQSVCDRVLVINKGEIVADDTPENLSTSLTGSKKLLAKIDGEEEVIYESIKLMDNITTVVKHGEKEPGIFEFTIEYTGNEDMRKSIVKEVSSKGAVVLSIVNVNMSLEDIFLELTGNDSKKTKENDEDKEKREDDDFFDEVIEYNKDTNETNLNEDEEKHEDNDFFNEVIEYNKNTSETNLNEDKEKSDDKGGEE